MTIHPALLAVLVAVFGAVHLWVSADVRRRERRIDAQVEQLNKAVEQVNNAGARNRDAARSFAVRLGDRLEQLNKKDTP